MKLIFAVLYVSPNDEPKGYDRRPIKSAKLESSSTAEFITNKIGRFYRSSVIGFTCCYKTAVS